MKLPYNVRIMACLPGHEPIEICRSKRPFAQSDWNYWTGDLDPAWRIWIEKAMLDTWTITRRPVLPEPDWSDPELVVEELP